MAEPQHHAGLCESCDNARVLEAASGARFYLCRLSALNVEYAKYPRLPVVHCAGYRRSAEVTS